MKTCISWGQATWCLWRSGFSSMQCSAFQWHCCHYCLLKLFWVFGSPLTDLTFFLKVGSSRLRDNGSCGCLQYRAVWKQGLSGKVWETLAGSFLPGVKLYLGPEPRHFKSVWVLLSHHKAKRPHDCSKLQYLKNLKASDFSRAAHIGLFRGFQQ